MFEMVLVEVVLIFKLDLMFVVHPHALRANWKVQVYSVSHRKCPERSGADTHRQLRSSKNVSPVARPVNSLKNWGQFHGKPQLARHTLMARKKDTPWVNWLQVNNLLLLGSLEMIDSKERHNLIDIQGNLAQNILFFISCFLLPCCHNILFFVAMLPWYPGGNKMAVFVLLVKVKIPIFKRFELKN